jgi:Protein of unknown function (DUF1203)
MTTATQANIAFTVRAIPADVVRQLLEADDGGNPPRLLIDDEGGSPLRCCLQPSRPGERIALVSYAPLRRWARAAGAEPGPYDEVGPVFIHPQGCEGPSESGFPRWLASHRMLRAYSAAGHILGGRLFEAGTAPDPAGAEAVVAEMFADPDVALVHARAVEFGCFTFEMRRA